MVATAIGVFALFCFAMFAAKGLLKPLAYLMVGAPLIVMLIVWLIGRHDTEYHLRALRTATLWLLYASLCVESMASFVSGSGYDSGIELAVRWGGLSTIALLGVLYERRRHSIFQSALQSKQNSEKDRYPSDNGKGRKP